MNEPVHIFASAFVERELHSVADGRPSAGVWFAKYGMDEAAMNAVAVEVGRSYVERRVSFSAGSSFMNALMAKASWEAPKSFWSIYLAFEDFETRENLGDEAVFHMANTLKSVPEFTGFTSTQLGSAQGEA